MHDTMTRELTFGEAVREAIAEEMRRDSHIFVIGEDVAEQAASDQHRVAQVRIRRPRPWSR